MRRILVLAMFGLMCIPMAGCGGCGGKRLNGAGSSFVFPLMTKWADLYKKEKKVEINYQSKGSSAGIKMMTEKSVDFGGTDAPLNEEQLEKAKKEGGEVVHIPLVMGGVVPAYNLKGVKETLKFTGPVLAKIFLRQITSWDDKELQDINPGVKLPDREIKVVHRSDGSGTTYIFTDYLSEISPEWNKKVGKSTEVKWPRGTLGAKGTEGVAGEVARTEGAIGYIELIYALENNIKYGSVQNKEGKYIKASLESVTAAARGALKNIPDDLRYSIVNPPGKDAYPISGTTWAVVYVDQSSSKHGKELVDFLRWITHEGQDQAKELHYARLPTELVKLIDKKLDKIKVK
jgi:phosphate transport system substrate-binding protein